MSDGLVRSGRSKERRRAFVTGMDAVTKMLGSYTDTTVGDLMLASWSLWLFRVIFAGPVLTVWQGKCGLWSALEKCGIDAGFNRSCGSRTFVMGSACLTDPTSWVLPNARYFRNINKSLWIW